MNTLLFLSLPLCLTVSGSFAAGVVAPIETDIFVSGTEGYHTFRIPAIVATNQGTILAICEGRRGSLSDTGDIDMVLRRSTDGGKSWSRLQVIWHDGNNTCGNPCPVVDRSTETVWLAMTHNLGSDGEADLARKKAKGTRTVWVSRSDDNGATWTKPVDITATAKKPEWGWYATGPGVGIQLERGGHNGRLLIPCNHTVQPDRAHPDRFEYGNHVIYSDDHGKSWQLGGVVPALKIDEPQAVELSDGSIMMNMRSHFGKGCRAVSISGNGGETWGDIRHEEALIEPDCQASFLRYSYGKAGGRTRLLFSNPASKQRDRMTVRLSYDDGKTWPVSRLLYAGPAAYSCLTVLPDMTMGCLYERGAKDPYEKITFARFTLEWLTDGKDSR
ncbi:MAG: exo-alpha-sialidase [Phycisphaerae bacterium]|nr:exo-alpha-sialidase [Phycisphaerae bacterium]